MFTKKGFSVRPLEVTNQVLVDDIHNCSEEYLHLYYENEGGDVEDVILNEVEQSAIITFKDHQAFKTIMKKKHYIKNKEIRVYPYYTSLGRALYGKDKPSLKLPASISEPIDSAVLRYLSDNKSAAEIICSEMEKHFCNINLSQTDTVTLSPVSSLLKQKDAKVLIKEWSDTVKSAFAQSVSKFKSLKFHPDPEAWKESEKKLREKLLNEDVIVVPDKVSGVLSVAGLVSDINKLERSLCEIINKIAKQVHRRKSSKTEEIKVSPSIFHLLRQDGLEDKLLLVYPELKMSPKSPNLKITGLLEEIIAASKVIFDAVLALKRQNLEIDDYMLELLKNEQQEELTDALLTSHRINAAFNISGNRVQLVAVSDRDLSNAQAHLTQLLTSEYISVEDSNVLKKPEWQQLVSQLEKANSKPCRTRINTTAQQAVVSGYKDTVIKVSSQLNDFLTQNAQIVETVTVKGDTKTGFLAQLVDGTDSVPKTLCHFQTIEGVEIAVSKADMCTYPVQAVISPSNQNLKHGTNLAAALLKADDHQLQDESDKIIKKRGQLKTGDCVITDAGDQLCCKKVIHVVVPLFEKDKPQKALAQLKKAVKGSLELAESQGCISVALPSIGRDQGFPPKQCELTIVKAVKEYCDENYDDITLQKIHLVNTDDSAVQDMVAAVREVFGNYGVTHSQQTPPKATQTSVLQPTGSNPHLCNEEDEELCSTSAVIGNIPDNTNQEFLEMLVENILKVHGSTSSSQSFILEVLPDISSAVVTFQSGKENSDFMKHCFQNKMFTKKGFSVRPLEVTNEVLVDDIHNNSEEYLHLYFENEGGDVEDVILNEVEQSAVITFKDHQAFKTIMKKKHYIKNEEIRVYPYYTSLGRALYGKDKPSLKLPASISEPVDSAVLRYLSDNKSAAETICSEMEKHFCNINLSQTDTVTLSPVSSLLKQKDAKVLIKEWSDNVKSAFAQSVSKFKSLKFHPDPEAWKESEKKLREKLLNEDVIVVPDKVSGVLSVAGLVSDINRLERSLCEIINKVAKKVYREKSSKTEELKVSPSIFHLLHQDGLEDKLLLVYPELKMSPESPNLKITGLVEEIIAASKVIFDAVLALKRQNLEIDDYVLELLKHEQQEELTDALLTSHQTNAAFDISGNRVQLVAVSDRDLYNAQAHLTQLLTSQYISVEDSNVLKNSEWQQLVSQLEQANSKPCRTRINTTAQQVVVSGYKDTVIKVSSQLNDFLTQNAQIEETVRVKANAVAEYLKCFNTSWMDKVKDKVKVSYRNEAICLSGSRVDVTRCKTVVEGAVSSVVFDSLNVCKSGAKKLFRENEAVYFSEIKHKTGCLVQLVDETGGRDSLAFKQAPTPLYQLKTNTSTGSLQRQGGPFSKITSTSDMHETKMGNVTLQVVTGDITKENSDLIVNSSYENFTLKSGVSKAILEAAGQALEMECHNLGTEPNLGIIMMSPGNLKKEKKSMLKDFHSSMQQREAADPDAKDKGGWNFADIGTKFKALITGGNTEKSKTDKDFVIESLKVDATCFHICGDTQANVDSAKKWINDKISQEHQSIEIEDNAIRSFSDADRQKIVDMQKTMDISIRTESNKPKATLTIEGLSKDVLKANAEIIKMVNKVRDEEELNRKVELASATADWQYQQTGFQFQSFDEMTNFHLEEALQQKLPTVKVTVKGQDYTVTMPKGPATDSQGNILEIKRIELKGFHWDPMQPNVTSQAFPLQAGTQEYDEIQKLFQASYLKRIIIKIERIQNPGLWKSFQLKKHDMEVRNGHQNNERRLFHGTAEDTVATINDRGFNRSYAGKNAANYGNGTYFAVNASYAASNTYSRPNQNGEKFMYVCRILTGDYTLGQQGMIVPPAKGTGTVSTYLYDSVVDNMANPTLFVIFHDTQAYPEYLITFR